jgi:hypothetical protein
MNRKKLIVLAVSGLVLAGCNPFNRPAVEVSAKDTNLNNRWHATLTSPAAMAGAVQMTGTASMAPAEKRGATTVTLALANATDGGLHPWQVHHGQCGASEGVFGSADAYKTVKVGGNGRAESTATIELETPTSGSYFVMVNASSGNSDVTVACGNLAAPTP